MFGKVWQNIVCGTMPVLSELADLPSASFPVWIFLRLIRLPTVSMRPGRAGTRETAQGGIMYGYMFCLVVYCVLMFEGIVRDLET